MYRLSFKTMVTVISLMFAFTAFFIVERVVDAPPIELPAKLKTYPATPTKPAADTSARVISNWGNLQ
jgi:hypothetical protein